MTTQKDVAKRAGVSFITVSRVVNHKSNVKATTRERVLTAIKELHYYPNSCAQGLNASTINTIAIISDLSSGVIVEETSYYRRLLSGIERYCVNTGFDILLPTQRNDIGNFDVLKPYYQRKASGLVLLGVDARGINFQKIRQDNIPCAIIGELPVHNTTGSKDDGAPFYYLGSDNAWGTRQATEYLIQHGHTNIAYVHGNRQTYDTSDRLDSFKQVLSEHQLSLPAKYFFKGDFSSNSGKQIAHSIATMQHKPTAVVVATDLMAIGLLDGALSLGLRIPHDLSIVGFDGHEMTNYTRPPLATVVQNLEAIGHTAAELVVKQILGEKPSQKHLRFPVVFEPRESIASLPSANIHEKQRSGK